VGGPVACTPTARGTWRNEARGGLDDVQAQHWESLASALGRIEAQAAQDGVPLPRRLVAWAQWIEPIGRLSFPTGQVVSALDRHPRSRPLDTGCLALGAEPMKLVTPTINDL
jgi:hypothetical protein